MKALPAVRCSRQVWLQAELFITAACKKHKLKVSLGPESMQINRSSKRTFWILLGHFMTLSSWWLMSDYCMERRGYYCYEESNIVVRGLAKQLFFSKPEQWKRKNVLKRANGPVTCLKNKFQTRWLQQTPSCCWTLVMKVHESQTWLKKKGLDLVSYLMRFPVILFFQILTRIMKLCVLKMFGLTVWYVINLSLKHLNETHMTNRGLWSEES